VNELMLLKTTKEWENLLDEHDVMWGPVNNIKNVVDDPHVNTREMIVKVEHPQAGKHKIAGTPMKFSSTPCKMDKAAPELGAHTEEILSVWLDISTEEIRNLRESKAI
jgi:crotonobetainyl-CoA:carnitine CoA-transferase CaiB-like acyl-CoA transferase